MKWLVDFNNVFFLVSRRNNCFVFQHECEKLLQFIYIRKSSLFICKIFVSIEK